MSRYIEVRDCRDCPNSYPGAPTFKEFLQEGTRNALDCKLKHRRCHPPSGIPEWCPLPVLPVMVDLCDDLLRREEEQL